MAGCSFSLGQRNRLRGELRLATTTVKTMTELAYQRCIRPDCAATYDVSAVKTSCDACGSLLDVAYDWDSLPVPKSLSFFEQKWSRRHDPLCLSGVWRFRDLLPFAPAEKIVTEMRQPIDPEWDERAFKKVEKLIYNSE